MRPLKEVCMTFVRSLKEIAKSLLTIDNRSAWSLYKVWKQFVRSLKKLIKSFLEDRSLQEVWKMFVRSLWNFCTELTIGYQIVMCLSAVEWNL